MKRTLVSYFWMIGVVLVELALIAGLFLFSTHFQVLFVVLSSVGFLGLLVFLLFRRIKEQSNLKPMKEVMFDYLKVFGSIGIGLLIITFFLAFIKGVSLLVGRF